MSPNQYPLFFHPGVASPKSTLDADVYSGTAPMYAELVIARLITLIENFTVLTFPVSGGKDSKATMICGLEAIRRVHASGRKQAHHHVTTSNTTVENSSMEVQAMTMLDEVQDFIDAHNLPVTIHVVTPSLPAQFVVSLCGRGSLPRTPQNSVKNGKSKRPCSDSWKVQPQERLQKHIAKEAALLGYREPVANIGTRFDESTVRGANMASRGESDQVVIRNANGMQTLSPIANWTTDDVWNFLALFMDAGTMPFPAPIQPETVSQLLKLYRDANDGVCGVVLGEKGHRSPCSSRFGCWSCMITGDKDKSMESMLHEPEHAYMSGLSDFRNYLLDTQWDLSLRELVGRKLSDAGYLRVQADVYNYDQRVRMLYMLLTLDALEIERAEQHEADLARGNIPPTRENQMRASPMFTLISPAQLVAIDFFLGLHHYAPHAHPALEAWFEVHTLGRRIAIPKKGERLPKVPIVNHGWYRVGAFDADVPCDGLRSYAAEMWNSHRHPERVSAYSETPDGQRTVYYEEEDQFTVDAEAACVLVTCNLDLEFIMNAQANHAIEGSRFLLNEGILRLPRNQAGKYQTMAVRGQYFNHLMQKLNCTPAELDEYLKAHAITDAQHEVLLNDTKNNSLPGWSEEDLFEEAGELA